MLVRTNSVTPNIALQQGVPTQQGNVATQQFQTLDTNIQNPQQTQQIIIQRQQQQIRLPQTPKSIGEIITANDPNQQITVQQQMLLGGQNTQSNQPQAQPQTIIIQEQQNVVGNTGSLINPQQMNSKTKTALANMLTSRLNNSSVAGQPQGVDPTAVGVVAPAENTASGTLRMMTAQHNAALNQSGPVRNPQELLVLQHQQRRSLQQGGSVVVQQSAIVPGTPGPPPGTKILVAQPNIPPGAVGPFSPVRPQVPRSQFYGHNPNLPKLPPDLFLLGCTFHIVEYEETNFDEIPKWIEVIEFFGGEIEKNYCPKVTHVLCRTQRHGVVMQAIRDGKRCITAYWLNDIMAKKQVLPPWQSLHLPVPSIFGVEKPARKHIISTSGFENEEKIRVRQMIEVAGAIFTSYLSSQNTLLVCRKPDGEKYKKAKEWNIPVVNATWLSDVCLGNLSTVSQYEHTKYQQYNLAMPYVLDYPLVPNLMSE